MIKSYKLYLTLLISSVFIILCQNQLSIANFVSSSSSAALAGGNGPGGTDQIGGAQALVDLRDDPDGALVDKIRSRSLTFNEVGPGVGARSTDRSTTTLGSSSSSSSSAATSTSTTTAAPATEAVQKVQTTSSDG
ncbi:hypothetical protein pipiens_019540, partial [Culex pipiens pipiens]